MQVPVEGWTDIDVAQGSPARPGASAAAQRAFDLVLGLTLLLLCLPMIAILAAGSAISLRAWPFFVQERIGRGGRPFRFVKIRTLPPATNAYADKYSLAEVRIPRFTRLLRALHLDELPQLLLVARGRMSLVGPRPEMPGLHAALPPQTAHARELVRPGCTGLWQVSVGCDGLIYESPEYDEFYVANRSLRLDLWILGQTVRKVLRGGRGQVTLADVPAWAAPVARVESRGPDVVIDMTGLIADSAASPQLEPSPA